MWLSKLKKKKTQYILLGIIFTIAIALISLSTIITVVANTFGAEYYKGDSTADLTVITTKPTVVEKSKDWYESKGNEVRNYRKYDNYSISTNFTVNNKDLGIFMGLIMPIDNLENLTFKIEVIEGNSKQKAPLEGEIWIPSTVAESKDLKMGDIAKIIDGNGETIEFKVSAIINDSNQPSTTIGILYTYINEKDRELLKMLPEVKLVTMNTNKGSDNESKDLISYINEPLGGMVLDKSVYIMSATITPILAGGLGLMASVILIGVLLIILRSNIKNNILKEYKSIGIYKSMGYSSKKIRRIYLYGYALVSIIASIMGILISVPISNYMCNIMFKYLGVYTFGLISLGVVSIIFILFNCLVYLNVRGVLKAVNKIKPINAINIGLTSSKEKLKKSIIKNNSSAFPMAINDIFKYKKSNVTILIIFTLTFYISILFLNLSYSMLTIEDNLDKLFGTPKSQLVVTAQADKEDSIKEVKEYLEKDERAEEYYLWNGIGQSKITMDNLKYKLDSTALMAMTFDKFNDEDFSIYEGRNPKNENEVSLSKSIMDNNKLSVGDYITINVENTNKEFLITGSYASMMGNQQNLRLTNKVLSGGSNGNIAFVKLRNKDDYNTLKEDILDEFKGVSVDKTYIPLKDTTSSIVEIFVPVSIILLVGILAFAIINIMSIILSTNLDNRKNYGIMKGIGFSSKYIRRRITYRIMSLTILGSIIGLSINMLTARYLFKLALGELDLYSFSFKIIIAFIIATLLLVLLIIYICNRGIKKISTVELIME
ncbi:FtsX-like permease family protein [Clostridium gasigenes]|uniref:ABC transporter permease n=1 Tax=Clostridium gasigenes TaxID=94869 RepID=UPI001C0D4B7E|nr:FtsX-like permease family protein [Clostridium gasigenes]MBU3132660.1 FtsX-like permease family protein [Clostridium gasigenes]